MARDRARGGPCGGRRGVDHPHGPAPGQGRRAGGGHHRSGGRADRHRRGAGQGGPPGLLRGQRHARPGRRVRLDVGDLHACRRPGHLPGAPSGLRTRPVARVDRPWRRGQPPRRLAGAAGGRQTRVADGRFRVEARTPSPTTGPTRRSPSSHSPSGWPGCAATRYGRAILDEPPRPGRVRGAAASQPAQALPPRRPARLRARARAQCAGASRPARAGRPTRCSTT